MTLEWIIIAQANDMNSITKRHAVRSSPSSDPLAQVIWQSDMGEHILRKEYVSRATQLISYLRGVQRLSVGSCMIPNRDETHISYRKQFSVLCRTFPQYVLFREAITRSVLPYSSPRCSLARRSLFPPRRSLV
jgi:hypothetical protein